MRTEEQMKKEGWEKVEYTDLREKMQELGKKGYVYVFENGILWARKANPEDYGSGSGQKRVVEMPSPERP